MGGYRIQTKQSYGVELALLASVILAGSSIPRALKSQKPLPAGLSALALYGLYTFGIETLFFLLPYRLSTIPNMRIMLCIFAAGVVSLHVIPASDILTTTLRKRLQAPEVAPVGVLHSLLAMDEVM